MPRSRTKGKANGLGSIRKRRRKRKDGSYYEFWEGRVTTSYNPKTGEQIQRTVTGDSQQAVIIRMKEIMFDIETDEVMVKEEKPADVCLQESEKMKRAACAGIA